MTSDWTDGLVGLPESSDRVSDWSSIEGTVCRC